jgi:hypothetical protein
MKRNINDKLTAAIIRRDNARCRWCGFANATRQLEADHIVPESKGGKATMANLQCLCSACNKIKGVTELPPMTIQPAIDGFGDFATIEAKRDELTALVANTKQDTHDDLLALARKWRAEGKKKLTCRTRLNKLTTEGKVQKILDQL